MTADKLTSLKKHRVLIVDDHPVVRRGLESLVASEPAIEVCGGAEDVAEALEQVEALRPDVVVVDITLKNGSGLNLISEIKTRYPEIKTIVWSAFDEKLFAERTLRAGAAGYINKQEPLEHVVDAIRHVLRGEVYLSEPMVRRFLKRLAGGKAPEEDPIQDLSDRELEVLEMIGRGMTTQQIARKLRLSPKTVETHRERIKTKLNLKNSAELSCRAFQWVLQKG